MKRFPFALSLLAVALFLATQGQALTPIPMPTSLRLTGGERPVAEPVVTTDASLPPEGYRLSITPEAIRVTGGGPAGVFYARQTLAQLAAPKGTSLPCAEIKDAPRYAVRGFMHDTGRNFQSVESLKHQLDLFARYKLNTFHWHLTDNPAWRVESKVFPQITSAKGRKPGRDPEDTYTFDQIRDVIAYAKARHIRVIPELDMPGHSAFFKPVFGFTMDSPQGIEVLKQLISEFCAEIPKEDCPILHIGSDEVHIRDPKGFMSAIENHVRSLGRTPMVWAPGLPPFSPDTWQQRWKLSAKLPATTTPLVDSAAGYLNSFDPQQIVRLHLTHAFPKGAKGGILCCWPDVNVDDKANIFRHNAVWPTVLAFAEASWNGPGDLAAFEPRMAAHRDAFFANEPFNYVPQMQHAWRLENTGAILKGAAFLFGGRAGGKLLPAKVGTVAELRGVFDLPEARTIHLRVGFESPARSNRLSAGIPKQGQLDANGGDVLIDGQPIPRPQWKEPGKYRYDFDTWHHPANEIPLVDEELWWCREPIAITLPAGRHEITVRAPLAFAKQYWAAACLPVRFNGKHWVEDPEIIIRPAEPAASR